MLRIASVMCAVCLFFAVGCGGGSGGSGDPLALGRSSMYAMASGSSVNSRTNLDSALRLFEATLRARPDSSEARLWAAVCLVGLSGMEVSGVAVSPPASANGVPGMAWESGQGGEGWPAPDPGDGTIPGAPPDHDGPVPPVEPPHRLGLLWNLRHAIANPFTLLTALAPVADIRMGFFGTLGFWGDDPQLHIETLKRLDRADALLTEVEADAGFSVSLPDPDGDAAFIRVELPEVHLFHAYVHSLRTEVALALAYVRDIGPRYPVALGSDDDSSPIAWNPFRDLDRNADGRLSADEYLPADPFLTLRSAQYLTLARKAMLAASDHGDAGCAGVLARTAPDGYLINNVPPYREALQEMQAVSIPLLRKAAVGPIELLAPHYEYAADVVGAVDPPGPCLREGRTTFNLDPDPGDCLGWGPPTIVMRRVRLNLAAWFDAPPRDLKVLAPTIGLTPDGWLDFESITLPDPTFAGLFPDGVPPQDFLYGEAFPMPLMAGDLPGQ
ncbi:MAG: hypothetical protein GX446_11875 [Chthonomonadales bacterium]|nr:hypothetical protein [Chthonomonadales bacterium]